MKQLRELISKVRRDHLEHVFVAMCFLWIMLIAYILFGITGGSIAVLLYILGVLIWEFKGETPFNIMDMSVSIIPIIPAVILMLNAG